MPGAPALYSPCAPSNDRCRICSGILDETLVEQSTATPSSHPSGRNSCGYLPHAEGQFVGGKQSICQRPTRLSPRSVTQMNIKQSVTKVNEDANLLQKKKDLRTWSMTSTFPDSAAI